jgi:nicotinate phosphoribosyltransferase
VIYKLCETMNPDGTYAPIMKLSEGKATLPGRKQVYRFKDAEGNFEKDVIALADEQIEGEPLLRKVMEKGKLIYNLPSLGEVRANASANLAKLLEKYRRLKAAPDYPVEISKNLDDLIRNLRRKLTQNEILHSA